VNSGEVPSFDEPPDLVHGYHVVRGGVWAKELGARFRCPVVMSLGGTDHSAVALGLPGKDAVFAAVDGIDLLTGAFQCFSAPWPKSLRFEVVPRSVAILPRLELRAQKRGLVRALLPAGLRPVKDVLFAIHLAKALRAMGVPLNLTILGPQVDREYAREVERAVAATECVSLGVTSRAGMTLAYESADVLWNTSLHEGGANAVLEGVAHGLQLFLRDVIGNREYFRFGGAPGMLFAGDMAHAARFHFDLAQRTEAQRREAMLAGHRWLEAHFSPEAEREALLRSWRPVLASKSPTKPQSD
jgi:glycosyltransferase involved in cell wall biosynthesis